MSLDSVYDALFVGAQDQGKIFAFYVSCFIDDGPEEIGHTISATKYYITYR